MRAFRIIFIVTAILGGIVAPPASFRGLRMDDAVTATSVILFALLGLAGAIPGLMLFWLASPPSRD